MKSLPNGSESKTHTVNSKGEKEVAIDIAKIAVETEKGIQFYGKSF